MSDSEQRGEATLRGRLALFGRHAGALRARIGRGLGLRDAPAEDNDEGRIADTAPAPPARRIEAPAGLCLYAVGDIHGRRDLLERLVELIRTDAAQLPDGVAPQIVFLGDYIDRGLQSRDVISFFTSGAVDAFDPVYLMGNHEEALLRFHQDATFGSQWARYGGARP